MSKVVGKTVITASIIFTFFIMPAFGQEKFDITVSLGSPELINAGIRFNIKQFQPGLNFGFLPAFDTVSFTQSWISVSGNLYYHFAGKSYFSTIRPWYCMGGISYVRVKGDGNTYKAPFLNLKLGREVNLFKNVALTLDAGVLIRLNNISEENDNELSNLFTCKINPSYALTLIIRLLSKKETGIQEIKVE